MNFLGIGSGLDLSTMLDGLVKVASEPKVQQLGRREIQLEDSLSGLGILKSKLSDFQSAADALKDAGLYTAMTPTLTQPASGDLIKVEAGSNAVASNYDIEVVSLASGSKAMSDWRSVKYQSDIMTSDSVSKTDPQNISGDLTFEFGGGTANVTIAATDSLDAIKDKINAISGVSAKVTDDGRLEYNLDDSTQTLSVYGSGDSLRGLENVAAYQTSAFADTTVDMGLTGNLSFDLGGTKTDIDLAGQSLDALANDINAIAGVSARVFEGKLEYFTDDGSELKVTASNDAIKGFANSQSYASATFADPAAAMGFSGTLSFGEADVSVAVTDTLQDLQAKIDALDGISASIHDGSLVYEADDGSTLSVVADDASLDAFTTSDMTSITGSIASAATGMSERAVSDVSMSAKGQLNFEADGKTFSVLLEGDETLDEIVSKINSDADNFGVTANIIDGKLVYQSSITGIGNDLSVSASDGTDADGNPVVASNLDKLTVGAGNTAIVSAATDAEIMVDGVSVTNDTNTFDGAVAGLTITALKQSKDAGTADAETAGVSVGTNSGSVKGGIEKFISTYNALRETMNELKGTVDEDGNFIAGKLSNDPIMRNVESVLNSMVTAVGSEASDNANTLFSIGIEITDDGLLTNGSTDTNASDRWSAAMSGSMEDLKKLFAGDGTASGNGLADQISDNLDSFLGFTGIIKGKEDSFQQQLDDLDEQYEAHARYIESYQKTLKQQFTALDATMAKMNSIMQYIGPQLAALPGVAK